MIYRKIYVLIAIVAVAISCGDDNNLTPTPNQPDPSSDQPKRHRANRRCYLIRRPKDRQPGNDRRYCAGRNKHPGESLPIWG